MTAQNLAGAPGCQGARASALSKDSTRALPEPPRSSRRAAGGADLFAKSAPELRPPIQRLDLGVPFAVVLGGPARFALGDPPPPLARVALPPAAPPRRGPQAP